jgi:hypothetical protein
MGLGPIPYSATRRYAEEREIIDRDEFDFFLRIIEGLDVEYLELNNASSKKDKAEMVPITDIDSQHLLFDRLRARANAKKKS